MIKAFYEIWKNSNIIPSNINHEPEYLLLSEKKYILHWLNPYASKYNTIWMMVLSYYQINQLSR